jgi:hypothetical protein
VLPQSTSARKRIDLKTSSIAAAIVLALATFATGCWDEDPAADELPATATAPVGGTTRSFVMGISAQPAVPTEFSYRDTFAIAEEAGEVVLVQRGVPWSDFVPGGSVSSRTEQLTILEKELAEQHDVELFLAVDPTSPGDRGHLAGLPEELAGAGFDDAKVRAAFVAYAKYLALNYKPAYMALGVEVDMVYAAGGDASFGEYLSLYFEAYDAVKAASPDTLVFPTFQYEDMLGILHSNTARLPSWTLIDRFEPRIDMLAVSSYPGLVFNGIGEVPAGYYMELREKLDRPVAFVSVGWNSDAGVLGEPGESSQVTYLYRVLAAADELGAEMLIWHLGRDPEVLPAGFEPLAHMGLHDVEGRAKQAWRIWLSTRARPAPALP